MRVPPEETRHGRCEATNRQGERCGQPAMGGHGKCYYHGGASDNTVHGLRQQHLTDEDRELYEDVSDHEPVEHILEEFHFVKTKLLRAARETEGEGADQLVKDVLEDIPREEVDEDMIRALADLSKVSHTAVDRAVGRLIQLAREYRKWTDGEKIELSGEVETQVSDSQIEELKDDLSDAFGDG